MADNLENVSVKIDEKVDSDTSQGKKNTKTLLATNESGLSVQGEYIVEHWKLNPHIVIGRAAQTEVADWLASFKAAGKSRHTISSKRTDITINLNALEIEINDNLRYVKHYIEEEFGFQNAKAHYYKFGIEKSSSMYDLGISRDTILMNLKKLIEGIIEIGYTERKYGLAFWQPLHDEFETLLAASKEKEGKQSVTANEKAVYREKIREAFKDLAKMLELMYPENFLSVQKEWGFLKSRT